jgi:hypothetical protein
MRRSTALMSVAAVALMASNAFAQAKPNFAGTWNMVQDPAAQQAAGGGGGGGGGGGRRGGGGGGGGFAGMTFTVAQDANTVTITRTQGENTVTTKYMLDGTDSKNSVMGRGGQATEVVSKAKWDGNALVISTTRMMGENSVTTTQKVWIEGDALVVENTSPNFQDPTAAPTVRKTTYKKG